MRHLLILFVCGVVMAGCASKVTTSGTASGSKYSEDLSVWRPEAEVKKRYFKNVGNNAGTGPVYSIC